MYILSINKDNVCEVKSLVDFNMSKTSESVGMFRYFEFALASAVLLQAILDGTIKEADDIPALKESSMKVIF